MSDRPVRFVTYQHATDRNPAQQELTFEDLCTWLEPEEVDCNPCPGKKCPQKHGEAWSPGFIPAGKTRLAGNVEALDVAAFDIDGISQSEMEGLCGRLEGLEVLLHSTHSHSPSAGKNNFRLIFALSRPVTRKEWPAFWHAVVKKYEIPADKQAKDPARIYFSPRRPRGAPFLHAHEPGEPLDVVKLLLTQFRALQPPTLPISQPREPGTADLGGLRSLLKHYNPPDDFDGTKRAFISRVLAGEPLAEVTQRDDAVHRTATIIAWQMPIDTPVEAAMELMRESVSKIPASDQDEPNENFDGWMAKAAYSYGKAMAAKVEKIASNNAAQRAFIDRQRAKREAGTADEPEEPAEEPESTEPEDDSWRVDHLLHKVLKSGEIVTDQTSYNVTAILENHPLWKGSVRFNEVTKDVECLGGPISAKDIDSNQLLTAADNWLQVNEALKIPSGEIKAQLLLVARRHGYDPLKDYLSTLKWDGTPRIDSWLETYCGARLIENDSDISEYVEKIGRRWLIAAVARGMSPGCKADCVLVLEGPQSAGKSTTLDILGGAWFADSPLVLTDKDSRMLAAQSWIIELAELSAMRSTEVEAQKAFFSTRSDKFRPPYGHKVEPFPRRCVFAGTTNIDNYLKDTTGNRRYWPVYCEEFDLEGLSQVRDQLWAEAVVIYLAGGWKNCEDCKALGMRKRCLPHRWWFERDESEEAEQITNRRLFGGDFVDIILAWWSKMEPDQRPESFSLVDLATDILGISKDRIEDKSVHIGRALKRSGFDRVRRREDGYPRWLYLPNEELRTMVKGGHGRRHLTLVSKPGGGSDTESTV